jgi:serine protease Do
MRKIIAISIALSGLMYGFSINEAPKNPTHRLPNGQNEVLSFNSILKKAMKSVVNISTSKLNYRGNVNRKFFREFFGMDLPPKKSQNSLGSGVIISSDGYIVTNNHVVEGADEISVYINSRDREYVAKVIGRDKDSDLAVIKIEANDLEPIAFSDIKDVKLGDVVFAIGDPFGVGLTATQGIISAMNKYGVGINKYENFIQTDASINPGNSGGALVDSRGALIGINSAIISSSGGNNGIGFAIPVDMVKSVVTKLITKGRVDRGYIGINISKVTKDLETIYKRKNGAVVVDVQENTPASRAGLQRGDLIYAVDGEEVKDPHGLQHIIMSHNPDDEVTLSIERDGTDLVKRLKLGNLDGDILDLGSIDSNFEGLYLTNLDDRTRRKFGIPYGVEGVVIDRVEPNSKAYFDGFNAGDIIVQVENIGVKNLDDIKEAFSKYKNRTKRIYINRRGTIFMVVK